MKKKIILISIAIIIISLAVASLLHFRDIKRFFVLQTVDLSNGAGAILSSPNPSDAIEADAINTLQKSLPLSTPGFVISSYDFSKGKFIVQNYYKGSNLQLEFDTWYQTSSYSAIPKQMFLLQ